MRNVPEAASQQQPAPQRALLHFSKANVDGVSFSSKTGLDEAQRCGRGALLAEGSGTVECSRGSCGDDSLWCSTGNLLVVAAALLARPNGEPCEKG
mmetsp:Transcript_68614/g.130648  ORF Transcript_68614/g.130648 Transcript_68614/m.130648 type:complete len:96 (+) Transcript_68614:424-711(+)